MIAEQPELFELFEEKDTQKQKFNLSSLKDFPQQK